MSESFIQEVYPIYESGRVFPQVKITHVKKLPFRITGNKKQEPFIKLVDKILAITESDNYRKDEAKQKKVRECEKQIDQLVYKLYGLTSEEIKSVENFDIK